MSALTFGPLDAVCPLQPAHPAIWFAHRSLRGSHDGHLMFPFDHWEMGIRVLITLDMVDNGALAGNGVYEHLSVTCGRDRNGKFYPGHPVSHKVANMVLDEFMPRNGVKIWEVPGDDPATAARHFWRLRT